MLCPFCQSQQKDDVRFCNQCGSPLKTTDFKKGKLLDNRYEIIGLIGKGGMGALYKVKDLRLMGSIYALKEMIDNFTDQKEQAEAISWFKREAEILCRDLRHPNIPVVKDFFIERGRYYLVMDFISGKDLESAYSLPIKEADAICFSLTTLDILDYIHKKKVIHRDIKPENFIIENDTGKIFLVDFGTATIFSSGKTKTAIGTQGYASPEHYEGKADERSDIYSLGATIHRLITGVDPKGRAPFTFEPVLAKNPNISNDLAAIIEKAISYKPEDRYQQATDMRDAVLKISSQTISINSPAAQSPATLSSQSPSTGAQNQPKTPSLPKPLFFAEDSVTLKAHKGWIFSAGISPDRNLMASGGGDNILRLFDLSTGNEINSWSDYYSEIRSVAFSPGGEWLATGSGDTAVKIIRLQSTQKGILLTGHSSKVNSVCFSPGGTYLASGSQDMTVCIFETKTWKKITTIDENRNWVNQVAFSPRGKAIAFASADGTITLFDTKVWNLMIRLREVKDWIYSISFYPVGSYIAGGLGSGTVNLWDIKTGAIYKSINAHKGRVFSLMFSPCGSYLATGGEDRFIKIWDPQNGVCIYTSESAGEVHSVCFSSDGSLLASSSSDGCIHLWKIPSIFKNPQKQMNSSAFPAPPTEPQAGKQIPLPNPGSLPQQNLKTSPAPANATQQASHPVPETLPQSPINAKIITKPLIMLDGHEGGARSVSFSSNGDQLAIGTGNGELFIRDTSSGLLKSYFGKSQKSIWTPINNWIKGTLTAHSENITSVSYLPSEDSLITASCDGQVFFWHSTQERGERIAFSYNNEIFCAEPSSDSKRIAAGSKGEIIIIRIEQKELEHEMSLKMGDDWIHSVSFSPDNKFIISGDEAGLISIWDLATQKIINVLRGHKKMVCSVSCSPNGKTIASGSIDGTIRLWNFDSGMTDLAITDSNDGKADEKKGYGVLSVKIFLLKGATYIASCGEDMSVKIREASSGNLLTQYKGHKARVNDVSISENGKMVASGSEDGVIAIWKIQV